MDEGNGKGKGKGKGEGRAATWSQRTQVLTHVLTYPTVTPSLHSQLFVASRMPLLPGWTHYPPLLAAGPDRRFPPRLLRWSLGLFLRRAARFGLPPSSWRSKCPFQQPPPLVLSSAVEPPPQRLGPDERSERAGRRLRRRRVGFKFPPLLAFLLPNVALLSVLLWDELWITKNP